MYMLLVVAWTREFEFSVKNNVIEAGWTGQRSYSLELLIYISKSTTFCRCLVQACTSLYKMIQTGRIQKVKPGILRYKSD
jgi:hypothetical protein